MKACRVRIAYTAAARLSESCAGESTGRVLSPGRVNMMFLGLRDAIRGNWRVYTSIGKGDVLHDLRSERLCVRDVCDICAVCVEEKVKPAKSMENVPFAQDRIAIPRKKRSAPGTQVVNAFPGFKIRELPWTAAMMDTKSRKVRYTFDIQLVSMLPLCASQPQYQGKCNVGIPVIVHMQKQFSQHPKMTNTD